MAEVGFPRIVYENWFGLVAPTGTPKGVVARLHREVQTFAAMPETKQRLATIGVELASAGPEQFAALLRSDLQKMVKLVRDTGIKPD